MTRRLLATTLLTSLFTYTYAAGSEFTGLKGLIDGITSNVVSSLSTLFLAGSVAAFFLGIIRFILAQQNNDTKGIETGKEFMKWGLVALFVSFSVYGIIRFAQHYLLNNYDGTSITIPQIQVQTGGVQTGGNVQPSNSSVPAQTGVCTLTSRYDQPCNGSGHCGINANGQPTCVIDGV